MYKNVLSSIPGIEHYPIVALVLFFGFFIGLIVWYFRADRSRLDRVARLPLEESAGATHPTTETHT
jgi:cytochrome c oxidase cbb3-type subunit IV